MRTKLFVALVLVLLVATGVAQAGNQLWVNCIPQENEVRCRYVEFIVSPEQIHEGAVFKVALFNNAKYKLVATELKELPGGWKLLSGHVRGVNNSYFYILQVTDSHYFVHVDSPEGVYHVQLIDGSLYKIVQEK